MSSEKVHPQNGYYSDPMHSARVLFGWYLILLKKNEEKKNNYLNPGSKRKNAAPWNHHHQFIHHQPTQNKRKPQRNPHFKLKKYVELPEFNHFEVPKPSALHQTSSNSPFSDDGFFHSFSLHFSTVGAAGPAPGQSHRPHESSHPLCGHPHGWLHQAKCWWPCPPS